MSYSWFLPTSAGFYQPVPSAGMQVCIHPYACKLKVEGKGTVRAKPDIAEVVLGVATENKELEPAQAENASRISKVLRILGNMGIDSEDIQTQYYNIAPQYDYAEGKQVFRGYRVEHMLKVIIRNISKAGEIIDAAVKNGANVVNSISFSVSDPTLYYQKALDAAVDNAFAKARTLEDKLNIMISQVPVQITEVSYEPLISQLPVMYETAAPLTPVQPGTIELTARIEAIFTFNP